MNIEQTSENTFTYKERLLAVFRKLPSTLNTSAKVFNPLTANVPIYRNQSVDLQSKSTGWFLYDGNIGR